MKIAKRLLGKRGGDSTPAAESSLLLARNPVESHIYMDLHPCGCGEGNFPRSSSVVEVAGDLASRYTGSCAGCGAMREFLFRLPQEATLGGPIFGYGGPSELLDAGEWLFVADRYASIVPAQVSPGTEAARVARHQLATAEAAMGEALTFVPKGADAVPAKALWSDRGRAVYNAEPGRFRRERLEVVRDTYRQILAEMDAAAG